MNLNIKGQLVRVLAALCVTSLLMTGCAQKSAAIIDMPVESHWYDSESEYHADVDFADMEYVGIDPDYFGELAAKTREDIDGDDSDVVVSDYDAIIAYLSHFSTQYAINNYRYYTDVTNEEYAAIEAELDELYVEQADAAYQIIRDIAKSKHADAVMEHAGHPSFWEDILEYEDMTPRQKEISNQITALTQEYDQISMEDESEDKYLRMAEVYPKLVSLYNEIAESYEYDNYADYAYECVYYRDFTTDDIKEMSEYVKEYIVPLSMYIENLIPYNDTMDKLTLSEAEKIERVAPIIPKIDPELTIAWDYMIKHHLYDMEPSEEKMDVGYTISLEEYGSAFIFDAPYCSWDDVQTVIHEYGHYNEKFHNMEPGIYEEFKTDIAEIHSQGLELLAMEYADEIYGEENASYVILEQLDNMMWSIISGCIQDEFQVRAYKYDGELDVETLNRIFSEVAWEYGYDWNSDNGYDSMWVNVTHTFHQPLYYIGYATSALAALDIMAMAQTDRQAAIDCYMYLTTFGDTLDYRELLHEVGLPDVFEEGGIEDISIAIQEYADEVAAGIYGHNLVETIVLFIAVLYAIAIVVIIIGNIVAWRKRRKPTNIASDIQ